jgi:hypothetical protein
MNKNPFFVGLILAASRLISSPIALLGGLVFVGNSTLALIFFNWICL